jgi:hypothetical protein
MNRAWGLPDYVGNLPVAHAGVNGLAERFPVVALGVRSSEDGCLELAR